MLGARQQGVVGIGTPCQRPVVHFYFIFHFNYLLSVVVFVDDAAIGPRGACSGRPAHSGGGQLSTTSGCLRPSFFGARPVALPRLG